MRAQRRGLALTTTLMAMVVLFLVGATMVTLGSSNLALANSQANSERAFYVAEAGLAMAMSEVAGSVGDPALSNEVKDGVLQNSPTSDSWHAELYKGPATVPDTQVQVPTGYWYILVSGTARSGANTARATARVGALVTRTTGGNYQLGALIKSNFELNGGRMVGWDKVDGGEVSGRDLFALLTEEPGQGKVKGAESEVDGKAFVQESTDPNQIMNYTAGAAPSDVLGGVTALPEALQMPAIAPPEGLDNYTDTVADSAITLPVGYYPKLTVKAGGVVSLNHGLYRFGTLDIEEGGQLHLGGSSLNKSAVLFVDETCRLHGSNAIVNSFHDPARLWLHYFGEQPLVVRGGADAYYCVSALRTKVRLSLGPGGTFWGTVTADSLDQDGGTFYYDTSLTATSPTTTVPLDLTLTGASVGGTNELTSNPNPGEPTGPSVVELGGAGGGLVVVARQRL